jgi:hypothetical protein
MLWFLYCTLCDVDTLDQLVRHCNWDPTAEVTRKLATGKKTTTQGAFIDGVANEDHGLTYAQLQSLCPSVLNEKAVANLFRTSTKTAQMKRIRKKTPKNTRLQIYSKEISEFEEPLRTLIHKFREWYMQQPCNRRRRGAEAETYHPEENPGIVQLTGGGPDTFHVFRRANMFDEGQFSSALLTELEKSFTAVHVRLPKNMGEDGDLSFFESNLTLMLEALINTTTQVGLVVKVHNDFVSRHVICLLDPKTEIY